MLGGSQASAPAVADYPTAPVRNPHPLGLIAVDWRQQLESYLTGVDWRCRKTFLRPSSSRLRRVMRGGGADIVVNSQGSLGAPGLRHKR